MGGATPIHLRSSFPIPFHSGPVQPISLRSFTSRTTSTSASVVPLNNGPYPSCFQSSPRSFPSQQGGGGHRSSCHRTTPLIPFLFNPLRTLAATTGGLPPLSISRLVHAHKRPSAASNPFNLHPSPPSARTAPLPQPGFHQSPITSHRLFAGRWSPVAGHRSLGTGRWAKKTGRPKAPLFPSQLVSKAREPQSPLAQIRKRQFEAAAATSFSIGAPIKLPHSVQEPS